MSLTQFCTAYTYSFPILIICRVLHGIFASALNPLTFSLIRDNFPAEKRGTANSILTSSNYISIALSSISIMVINQVGWRGSYAIMGGFGAVSALMTLLFVKKAPPVAVLEQVKTSKKARITEFFNSLKEINSHPVCKNLYIAGAMRSVASMAITCFLPVFFS